MWRKNQYQLEPGTYRNKSTDETVVVSELVTHEWRVLQQDHLERVDPLVVYRDLMPSVEKYVTYSLVLSQFNLMFVKI